MPDYTDAAARIWLENSMIKANFRENSTLLIILFLQGKNASQINTDTVSSFSSRNPDIHFSGKYHLLVNAFSG